MLVDLDQGATSNFPIDGYVATRAWAQKYPKTAAAFVRAIEKDKRSPTATLLPSRPPWRSTTNCRSR